MCLRRASVQERRPLGLFMYSALDESDIESSPATSSQGSASRVPTWTATCPSSRPSTRVFVEFARSSSRARRARCEWGHVRIERWARGRVDQRSFSVCKLHCANSTFRPKYFVSMPRAQLTAMAWYDRCYAAVCLDAWSGHPLHRDAVPVDINAVIIGSVLNGSEVYRSGRRLARAMLPISGGMCTSSTQLFPTATPTD